MSADTLVSDQAERDPVDELRLQFEAVGQLPPAVRAIVKEVLDGLIIKYQARRWDSARAATAAAPAAKKAAPIRRPAQAGAR